MPLDNPDLVEFEKISGKSFLTARNADGKFSLQQSFSQKLITAIVPGNSGAIGGIGVVASTSGVCTHLSSESLGGYSANLATSATANTTTSVSSTAVIFRRGSTSPWGNGFYYCGRAAFPDGAYTGLRSFAGLYSGTFSNSVNADDAIGDYAGFQYSTTRGDTTWKFITKDGSTQSIATLAGANFLPNKLYDFHIYCPAMGSTIYYQLDNIIDGLKHTGSTSSNLPDGAIALRSGLAINNIDAVIRNVRMLRIYTETDK